MPRRSKPRPRGQKGKKRMAQRNMKKSMRRKGFERSSPSYMGGATGVRAWKQRT